MNLQQTVPLLLVSDLERSREFYCEGLGFDLAQKWDNKGRLAWCWFQRGGAALMLQEAEKEEDPHPDLWGKGVTFYFICEDAEAIYRDITSRGIAATEPETEFYGMKQTFVIDPDGYVLCFEKPTKP